jgi:hypothetical protein
MESRPRERLLNARNRHPRHLVAVIAVVMALAAPAARAGVTSDDPSGFLRDRAALSGGVRATGTPEIGHELICAEDCVASGRVVIAARDAIRLGLGPVSERWVRVGRFQNVALEARTWKVLKIRLDRRLERRLRSSSVRIYGEAVAISLQSGRHGRAGWALSYER